MESEKTKIERAIDLGTDEAIVQVEYNDYQGGDAGHGGYLDIKIDFSAGKLYEIVPRRLSIRAEGDWEKKAVVNTLIELADILRPLKR